MRPSDQVFAEVEQHLGVVDLMQLLALVGLYELLRRNLRVWRTPPTDGP